MRTIIIDDERLARTELKRMLQHFPDIEIIDEASNAQTGLQKIDIHKPDLIFLDIQMPGKSGFDLLTELEHTPKVIFTTAYDEYALKAFEVNALDYLLKPIEHKRLETAIKKIEKADANESSNVDGNSNGELLTGESQVFVKDGEKCWFIKLKEVRLFESVGNYAKVFFSITNH